MVSDIFDVYNATEHLLFEEPTCITWVGGLPLPECVRLFGGDPLRTREADFQDIYEGGYDLDPDDPSDGAILLDQQGDWVVVVEPTSYRGISSALLKRLSVNGAALSVSWTVNVDAYVKWAEHGHVLYIFDPLALDIMNPEMAEVGWVVDQGVDLDAWDQNWLAATLTLAEKITSVRLDPAWMERPHVGVTVGPMPSA
ncbi:hypothetical protein C1J01_29025 [Nonomuraea aridisoli]|uniref:Uncharacterized protein n=2 Tax=Nonomuraea aridisoli TaxID=2070368 RepID=A0A2W2EWJ4_9ACTN|nr:hypothetical protein C1J01_29025 [Nonomuraea aridisoli]